MIPIFTRISNQVHFHASICPMLLHAVVAEASAQEEALWAFLANQQYLREFYLFISVSMRRCTEISEPCRCFGCAVTEIDLPVRIRIILVVAI